MDLKRCLEILELKNATSISQVKQAYRELVNVWHPDRFPSNSRIKQRAEEKMRDINIAYELLISFLSSEHQRDKLSLLEPKAVAKAGIKNQIHATAAKQKTDDIRTGYRTRAGRPRAKTVVRTAPPAGAKSSISGKFLVFGLLIIMVGISALIIHYLSKFDESTFEGQPQMSILKKLLPDTSKNDTAGKIKNGERIKTTTHRVTEKNREFQSPNKKSYCEIYLKEGNIIIAESWWEQNNMIMYKTKYGTMGIEKDAVEKIIDK
jgi:hypothetical protein